jgi:ABC transporter DrrB family efflux protein
MTATTIPLDIETTTGPPHDAGFLTASATIAGRSLRKFVRSPQLVVIGTLQGAMFLLIFRYVFGGAINTGPIPYVDFLVPGFVLTSVLFVGATTAAGVAEDMDEGLFDRLRSLPIARSSVLWGRALADTAVLVVNLSITVAIGFLVGFRIHTDAPRALAAFGLTVVFGFAFVWVFIFLGLIAGNAQAAQGFSLLVFPLTFVSSAYVPISTMPSWMQPIAEHQPITVATDAVRALTVGPEVLTNGATTASAVVATLLWSAALVLVFAPLATRRFGRRR